MNSPLVSIITPVYNAVQFIQQTVESVLDQTYPHWELLLIDDASTDHSLSQLKAWAKKDPRIKVRQQTQNLGVAAARNAGLALAKGKYIAFLDADDCWDEAKLLTQVQFMESHQAAISHTAYRKMDGNGTIIAKKIEVSKKVGYAQLLKHNQIGFLTAMYNQQLIGKVYFKAIGHEDFVFWLQILKKGHFSFGIPAVLASYRVHQSSISHNKIKAATYTWNIYRNVENLSYLRSCYYFTCYAINAGLKFIKR